MNIQFQQADRANFPTGATGGPPPGYVYPVGPGTVDDATRGDAGFTYVPDWTSISGAYGTISLPPRLGPADGTTYAQHTRWVNVPTRLEVYFFRDSGDRADFDVLVNNQQVVPATAVESGSLASYMAVSVLLQPGENIVRIRYRGNGETFYFDKLVFLNA